MDLNDILLNDVQNTKITEDLITKCRITVKEEVMVQGEMRNCIQVFMCQQKAD